MDEFAIRNLLNSKFEPFFREEILPELVPEFFSLSYESLEGQKISMDIHVALIRLINEDRSVFAKVALKFGYQNLNTPRFPWTDYWIRHGVIVCAAPDYTRFTVEVAERGLSLQLWFFNDGSLRLDALKLKDDLANEDDDFPIIEYREDWIEGRFNLFDARARVRHAHTFDEKDAIQRESSLYNRKSDCFDTPTRYLGSLVALMDMF